MRVTITLGTKAMEYVTGIPEEELPGILSDVLERSLEQQVRPIPSSESESNLAGNDILKQIREVLKLAQINPELLNSSRKEESTTVTEETKVREAGVDSSTPLDLGGELGEWGDLMK